MGRHSRPEDLEDDGVPSDAVLADDAATGRHASSIRAAATAGAGAAAAAGAGSAGSPAAAAAGAAGSAAAAGARSAAPEPARRRPRPQAADATLRGTAGDLKLIRDHSDVRHRCVAAVVVPFLIFTVALAAVGGLDRYLVWVFVPTIVAGVLVGVILDHAHKRYPGG